MPTTTTASFFLRRVAILTASFGTVLGASLAPMSAHAASTQLTLPVVVAPKAPPLDGALDDTWRGGAHTQLGWNFSQGKEATDGTDVYVVADTTYLYVAFSAKQREPVVATQQANNVGEGSDDEVFVYLWPSGTNGFFYSFSANPRGTRYQSSSENTAFSPDWLARGAVTADGYTVTMRIPLKAIRGDGRGTWLAQFARRKFAASETDTWAHDGAQTNVAQSIYAGSLTGMNAIAKSTRAQPRLAVYGLADAAAASAGGNTSRSGADVSIPITQTASILATVHPDFSNVERDQQSIAPTAFQRSYSEVRPFFTQTANYLDRVNCYGCPGISELYTPAIPTPRRGYAIEGRQGPMSFAAFDAVGDGRIDTSADISATALGNRLAISFDRTTADLTRTAGAAAVHDVVSTASIGVNDLKHFRGYVDYGHEQGTLVTGNAQRYDAGFAYYGKDDFDAISLRKVGASYSPYDGFVQLSDIAGYSAQANHTFRFAPHSRFSTVNLGGFLDRYASSREGTNLVDINVYGSVTTRAKVYASYSVGTSYTRLPGDLLRPFTQTGGSIGYNPNTPTTTSLSYYVGRYADGYLYTTYRQAGFFLAKKTTINLELDSTDWHGDVGTRAKQWLERASATYVLGRDGSVVIGARKIVGAGPPVGTSPLPVLGTNLTFALTERRGNDELYLVYGDASTFRTRPGATLKLIHYFGAQKGT